MQHAMAFPRSRSRRSRRLLALVLLGLLVAGATRAESIDPTRTPRLGPIDAITRYVPPDRLGFRVLGALRAAFSARYLRYESTSDDLSARFHDGAGPGVVPLRDLETRVTLSHALTNHVDLQVQWRTRNRLSTDAPLDMGPQFVGALIRITP